MVSSESIRDPDYRLKGTDDSLLSQMRTTLGKHAHKFLDLSISFKSLAFASGSIVMTSTRKKLKMKFLLKHMEV